MKHLLSPLDFSVEELDNLMDIAKDIEANPEKYAHACEGKKLATLFYEPSTRTRLSHEAAMINLGGSVLGFSSADSSSASKGESVADTIRVISCFQLLVKQGQKCLFTEAFCKTGVRVQQGCPAPLLNKILKQDKQRQKKKKKE